jgi:two-component system LytT family response regulator
MQAGSSDRLTILVVDDEPLAREGLRLLLAEDASVVTVWEASSGGDAVSIIREQRPDLVFLDVQMPEMDGLAVVREIGADRMPAIVFVTAHDQYAIHAFEINAIDYLLKPVIRERFVQSLARAKARLGSDTIDRQIVSLLETISAPPRRLQRLAIRSAGRISFLDVGDVHWIEAAENYVQLHTDTGCHMLRVPIGTPRSVPRSCGVSCVFTVR